jgi:hypothetical protein
MRFAEGSQRRLVLAASAEILRPSLSDGLRMTSLDVWGPLFYALKMRRILIGGVTLLLCGVITAHSKPDPLVFVFLRVDRAQDVAILRPMIAPDLGVQLDSGPRQLKPGTVLQCAAFMREHPAIVEGQVGKVSELMLDCGDRKFIIKTLEFSPRTK